MLFLDGSCYYTACRELREETGGILTQEEFRNILRSIRSSKDSPALFFRDGKYCLFASKAADSILTLDERFREKFATAEDRERFSEGRQETFKSQVCWLCLSNTLGFCVFYIINSAFFLFTLSGFNH